MSDREKLIEILKDIGVVCNVPCKVDEDGCGTYEIMGEEYVADHLISNGVTVSGCIRDCAKCWKTQLVTPKWIPVSERLPTEEDADAQGRVYAISEGAYPRMWQWSMVVRYPECFTHWYKLPEPPKECE